MKKLFTFLLLFLTIQAIAQVSVKGYYRSDGTYVQPHQRSKPDGNPYNNYSYPGNTNPHTGKVATGNPETYLKNYYGNNSSSNSNLSSITSASPISRTSKSYYVAASYLRLRSNPSTNSKVLMTLSYGEGVTVIESVNPKWKKVEISYLDYNTSKYRTLTGYVSSSFIKYDKTYGDMVDRLAKLKGLY